MFNIGISYHYATGEGITICIGSGSKESIEDITPAPFFHDMVILSPSEWVNLSLSDAVENNNKRYYTEILKKYLPVLWEQIQEIAQGKGPYLEVNIKYHFNYS